MDEKVIESSIRLFNGVVVPRIKNSTRNNQPIESYLYTLKEGFILDPEIMRNLPSVDVKAIINIVRQKFLISGTEMNQTIHKSWSTVKDSPIEKLIVDQVMHYISTYGLQSLGMYDDAYVYVPKEKLDIPKLKVNHIPFVYIHAYSQDDMSEKIEDLLRSGVALKEDTLVDIMNIVSYHKIILDMDQVKNREARIRIAKELGLIPSQPEEFLRLVIYELTGSSLLIKNNETISAIKESYKDICSYFKKYDSTYGLQKLATIFNRYKPLFLAMKNYTPMVPIVNRISKLSKTYHKPMEEDYLNSITKKIKRGDMIDGRTLVSKLREVNTFRKARLLYSLHYRSYGFSDIVYQIRNGKSFATKDYDIANHGLVYKEVEKKVEKNLIADFNDNDFLKGKKVYFPKNISYTIPATEKMFTGNFPTGTSIQINGSIVFGIHWYNIGERPVDLDLSLMSAQGKKIGWDSSYRNENGTVLFSGDQTSAPLPTGASEAFYLNNVEDGDYIVSCNYYNRDYMDEAPFTIFVGKTSLKFIQANHVIDPNKMIMSTQSVMDVKQKTLGFVSVRNNVSTFYFAESKSGYTRTVSMTPHSKWALNYYVQKHRHMKDLQGILEQTNDVKIVDNPTEADIDLSPEKLQRDTILKMMY